MSEQTDREAILREIAKKRVRYQLPGMDDLPVRRDIRYGATSGHALPMDIYYPRDPDPRPPVVVVAFGYPDPEGGIRQFGPYTSWAQLVAASGMAMVLYGSQAPAEDIYEVLRHLRRDADALRHAVAPRSPHRQALDVHGGVGGQCRHLRDRDPARRLLAFRRYERMRDRPRRRRPRAL